MKSLLPILSLLLVIPFQPCFGQDTNTLTSRDVPANVKSRFDELATRYKTLQEQFYAREPQKGEDELKRFLVGHPMNSMG